MGAAPTVDSGSGSSTWQQQGAAAGSSLITLSVGAKIVELLSCILKTVRKPMARDTALLVLLLFLTRVLLPFLTGVLLGPPAVPVSLVLSSSLQPGGTQRGRGPTKVVGCEAASQLAPHRPPHFHNFWAASAIPAPDPHGHEARRGCMVCCHGNGAAVRGKCRQSPMLTGSPGPRRLPGLMMPVGPARPPGPNAPPGPAMPPGRLMTQFTSSLGPSGRDLNLSMLPVTL
ncbi:hypothetical protein V8C86DRAFT_316564 [Haematococcus lacustris]